MSTKQDCQGFLGNREREILAEVFVRMGFVPD